MGNITFSTQTRETSVNGTSDLAGKRSQLKNKANISTCCTPEDIETLPSHKLIFPIQSPKVFLRADH